MTLRREVPKTPTPKQTVVGVGLVLGWVGWWMSYVLLAVSSQDDLTKLIVMTILLALAVFAANKAAPYL